ncbi:MAG: hypothetical protein KGR71_00270 [Proteobacteria bacterium]|nr:hypothetical protein [Pseudomonadota bacterium]
MFDIFTKSKVEPVARTPASQSARRDGLDDAWRIYHAIDRALKSGEAERKREGSTRTSRLDQDIAYYKILKAALLAGFPELNKSQLRSQA